MANSRIGCSNKKTSLVDPNLFYGQSSSNNMSVPLEDLSIDVQLRTFKKGRTVLSASNTNGKAESTKTLRVSFLKGSEINGKRVLTTNYTDLTTSFDSGNNNETLGITNIDIDFSSQQAPMVTINFIDLRGSAIFQNENNVKTGENDYSTFFQLPYPLYELTVKGYYGRSVKYCLHMTKFTSKFNSQTGNFEITANFIGYTYAMLSDMLLGYLKAIPYTNEGKSGYDLINAERSAKGLSNILNLNELMFKISEINQLIKKVTSDDPDSVAIHEGEEKKDIIEQIRNQILTFGQSFDIADKEKTDMYRYIAYDDNSDKTAFTTYVTGVKGLIAQFNNDNSLQLSESQFTSPPSYLGLTITELNSNLLASTFDDKVLSLKLKMKVTDSFYEKKNDLFSDLSSRNFSTNAVFNVYDMSSLYSKLDEMVTSIETSTTSNKKSLAITLKTKIADAIGFEPTIRNVVEVFTTAVEVYLGALFNVSAAASKNSLRSKELQKKFGDDKSTDRKKGSTTYFPWPDYREKQGTGGYMEKYLGDPGVLSIPSNVNELVFIEDLKRAFLKAQQAANEAESNLVNSETNWLPINPIDTKLFISDSPYKRLDDSRKIEGFKNKEEVIRLMLIRGMTFMGYSHSSDVLTSEDIIAMATTECDTVVNDVPNAYVKAAMVNMTLSDFINSIGDVNGSQNKVVTKNGGDYYYTYILGDEKGISLLPLSSPYEGTWSIYPDGLKKQSEKQLFLTNYGSANLERNNAGKFIKIDDGGVYLKMLTVDKYSSDILELRSTVDSTIKPLSLDGLKTTDGNGSGISVFGGGYGIQDFSLLDYGNDNTLKGLPLMYMFYDKHLFQGLSKTRQYSKEAGVKKRRTSQYDLVSSSGKLLDTINLPYFGITMSDSLPGTSELVYDKNSKFQPLHLDLGYNRRLSNKLFTETEKITYPFVNYLKTFDKLDENDAYSFSLFGNPWYYHQNKSLYPEYAKALLYLNTLPFTKDNNGVGGTFESQAIRHLFNKTAGFIHAPRLWCAYVGGLIWRYDVTEPELDNGMIIGGGSGDNDPILWGDLPKSMVSPSRDEYMNILTYNKSDYKSIHRLLKTMPVQAMNEFKKVFFEFVNGTSDFAVEWEDIKSELEVSKSYEDFISSMQYIRSKIKVDSTGFNATLKTSELINKFIGVSNNYEVFTPYIEEEKQQIDFKGLFLELKGGYDDNNAVRLIIDSMREEIVIANSCYFVWGETDSLLKRESIYVNSKNFELYFNTIVKNFNARQPELSTTSVTNSQEQETFGTSNDSVIKFQLYRTCKNIYDKWIGGAQSADKIIFQCGDDSSTDRNIIDLAMAKKNRGGSVPRLIDSYRFVSRSFRDIGDELFINPTPVGEFLRNNPNSSMYDAVGSLLADNNFNFTPLPTYINYNDDEILNSMFDTLSYNEGIANGTCGPTFVCVYIGQASKHLDLGNPSQGDYDNDGFDIQCNGSGGFNKPLPIDFDEDPKDYENKVAVFAVNYSQQNQNIFKDISLDQSEFGETAESLQIVDNIANNLGSENNRTFAGQNIYNVYSVRSYKAEVEMMGNAMIQPMMYFQLNNIPMFHGAYMITHVKHNITPNNMSTHFTGVRIREPETKIFDAADLYMSIIDSLDTASLGTGGSSTPSTLRGTNSEVGPFVNYEINETLGLKYQTNKGGGDNYAVKEVGLFMAELAKRWYTKNKNQKGSDTLMVNNFSAYGGGSYSHNKPSDQKSRHVIGLATDLRPMMNNKNNANGWNVGQAGYDSEKNKEFIQMVINLSDEFAKKPLTKDSGPLKIQNIILNDTKLIQHFSNVKGSQGNVVISSPGHNNHIHLEWDTPSRVLTAIKNHETPDLIVNYGKSNIKVKNTPLPSLNKGTLNFYNKLLDKLGAPKTDGNKFLLMAWSQIENSTCDWNAFNTKQDYGNSVTCINSGVNNGVQKYSNIDEGVMGTYITLTNGLYPNLVAALKGGIKDKQEAYNVAEMLQQAPKGDLCVWKLGGAGCKTSKGVPITTYVTEILAAGKMSGKNISGSK